MRPRILAPATCCIALAFATPALAQPSLTVYLDGRVMVRQTFPVRLPQGRSTVTIPLRDADPATLISLDPTIAVTQVRFRDPETQASLLRRALGRRIRFFRGDTLSAVVLSAEPLQLKLDDGQILLTQPGHPIFPPDLLTSHDSVALTVVATAPVQSLRLGYQTIAEPWRASYTVQLGRPVPAIAGGALLAPASFSVDSAEVHLYAGNIGHAPPLLARQAQLAEMVVTGSMRLRGRGQAEAVSQTVGSHRVYTLPGRHSLAAGETQIIPLFRPIAAAIQRVHLIDATANPIGNAPSGTPGQEIAIQIAYRADRPKGTDFGDQSLPAGIVSIYDGAAGRETLVGEGRIGHLAPGMPFLVDAGRALDLHAYRMSPGTEFVQDSTVNPNGSVTVRATAQVQSLSWVIKNGGDSTAAVELVERRPGKWRIVRSSIPAAPTDGGVKFAVTVAPGADTTITYRIRIDQ